MCRIFFLFHWLCEHQLDAKRIPCELKKLGLDGCPISTETYDVDGVCLQCNPNEEARIHLPVGQRLSTVDDVRDDDTIFARWNAASAMFSPEAVAKFSTEDRKLYGLVRPGYEQLFGIGSQEPPMPAPQQVSTSISYDVTNAAIPISQQAPSVGQHSSLTPGNVPPVVSTVNQQTMNLPYWDQWALERAQLYGPVLPEREQLFGIGNHQTPSVGQHNSLTPGNVPPVVNTVNQQTMPLPYWNQSVLEYEQPMTMPSLENGEQSSLGQFGVLQPSLPTPPQANNLLGDGNWRPRDESDDNVPFPAMTWQLLTPDSSPPAQDQGPQGQEGMQGMTTQTDLDDGLQSGLTEDDLDADLQGILALGDLDGYLQSGFTRADLDGELQRLTEDHMGWNDYAGGQNY